MEKGNTNNEKAVFFNGLGGTVNEDELRAILAREGITKLTKQTNNIQQKKQMKLPRPKQYEQSILTKQIKQTEQIQNKQNKTKNQHKQN
jgi:hypothetical protein